MATHMPHKLNAKATDNHGNEYAVYMVARENQPVVTINGTPGSWYLSTLLGHNGNELSIDLGANWTCTNWNEIRDEIAKTFV